MILAAFALFAHARLPTKAGDQLLTFAENKGQWDARARFVACASGLDLWLTDTGLVFDWHGPTRSRASDYLVSVVFVGATPKGHAVGLNPIPGPPKEKVHRFVKATVPNLYPGIDLVTYVDSQVGRPRYDLVVHIGANPNQIRMRFKNAKHLLVDREGSVNYDTPFGHVRETRQHSYQRRDFGPDYHFFPKEVLNPDGTIGFDVTGYRKDQTLVID